MSSGKWCRKESLFLADLTYGPTKLACQTVQKSIIKLLELTFDLEDLQAFPFPSFPQQFLHP